MAAAEGRGDQRTLEHAAASVLQEAWSRCRELYEDAAQGVQLVFDIVRRCYKTELPNQAKAAITEFVINSAKITIGIVTEDDYDIMEYRLHLVNPFTGQVFSDCTFNERDIAVARVALLTAWALEMPCYDLDDRQDIVTVPARLEAWRASSSTT